MKIVGATFGIGGTLPHYPPGYAPDCLPALKP